MAFWKRQSTPRDVITSEALAEFGRYEFLGAEQSGVSDPYSLVSALVNRAYPTDGPGHANVVAELRRHAQRGEWERVGAWKFVREFLSEGPDTEELINEGLLALTRMRVTNLAIHLAPIEMSRWESLTGAPPPNDGFFGPPVFDSEFGPTRQYYFDHAIATAAARNIPRVRSVSGVAPADVGDAARAMWDFGLLVYRGPLVVNPDIAFEPNVVRPAVQAADGVDHILFANALAEAVLDSSSFLHGVWSSMGGSRFVEEYLEPAAVDSPGYSRMLDSGLTMLVDSGMLGVAMAPELLTLRQRERLTQLRASAR
jgi:hypothetical protein